MTPTEAAKSLLTHLSGHRWLVAVRTGFLFDRPILEVHASSKPPADAVPKVWEGFAVSISIKGAKP